MMKLIVLVCLFFVASDAGNGDTTNLLGQSIRALDKAFVYLWKNIYRVNLDTVIGSRMVDGQMTVLLNRIKSGELRIDSKIEEQLKTIRDAAALVSTFGEAVIEHVDPEYYDMIGALSASHFWRIDEPSRDFRGPQTVSSPDGVMHEFQSDECVSELLGTKDESPVCTISDDCWKLMTEPGFGQYSLSHQVFYLQIGLQYGCDDALEEKALEWGTDHPYNLITSFCHAMWNESKTFARLGFPKDWRDLFMEQISLCGMMGFRQFANDDWLRTILSWQLSPGCFGLEPGEKLVHHFEKRQERQLPERCLAHRTGVGVAALSQFVRYMVEYLQGAQ